MLGLLVIISQAVGNILFSVLLTFSSETPLSLLSEFSEYSLKYNITSESRPSDLLKLSTDSELLIVDISSHPFHFSFLDSASELLNTVYLTVTETKEQSYSRYRYFAHLSASYEAECILNLTRVFLWDKFTILSSLKDSDLFLSSEIKSKNSQAQINVYYYSEDITETQADFIIKRKIKAEGESNLLIVDSGKSFKSLQKKLKERKVIRDRFQLIALSKSIYQLNVNGAFVVSEPGTEHSISESNYNYLRIQSILKQIPLKTNFRVFLKKFFKTSEVNQFSLINVQNSNPTKVGFFSDSVQITENITFPGNSSVLSSSSKNKIILSIANGMSEPYSQRNDSETNYFYRGAVYAVSRINLNEEIENFDLELFTTDCGLIIYEATWNLNCFNNILSKMGIAYLTSFYTAASLGNLMTLRALNYSIPQIVPFIQGKALGIKSLYPEFISLTVPQEEYYSGLIYFLNAMGWRSVNLIGSDDFIGQLMFSELKSIFNKYKIKTANPEESQIFPENYTEADFYKYEEKFSLLKNTLCRVYIIISMQLQFIIEGLYDIGLRKGEFIALIHTSTFSKINITTKYRYKLKELLTGSLVHNFKEYVGDYGKLIESEILRFSNDTSNFCVNFDTVIIVKDAISHLVAIGEDYEDKSLLNHYIRVLKPTGCTGTIHIDSDSNYRSTYSIAFEQILFDEFSENLLYNEVIILDKYNQNPIQISKEIIWPNSINIPANFIEMNSCGLNERIVRNSNEGKNTFLILSGLILLLTIISAVVSARIFKCTLSKIEKNTVGGINEKFFLIFFLFEYFQINLQGNRKGVLYEITASTFESMGFDFITFFKYEFDSFWDFMKVIFAIQLVFSLLCCIEIFLPSKCFQKFYVFGKVQDLNKILLPVLGHICLMPLVSMTLNIFMCKEGIGSKLEESYVELDCKTFCYKDKHKIHAVISMVSIISFLAFAIILRPYWEKKSASHIKTNPVYLAALSVFQVTITLISALFAFIKPEIIGFINSSIIGIFLAFTVFIKPYNYDQAALIQKVVLSMNLWDILFGCIYFNTNYFSIKILQLAGNGVILVIAVVAMKKLEKIFISEEDFPISNLILFQFKKNSKIYLKSDTKNLNVLEMNKLNYLEKQSIK